MTIRAMLAAKYDERIISRHLAEAGYLWMQPKIDGMRVLVGADCVPLSRSGKEFKQRHIRRWLQDHPSLRFLDGEVVSGHIYDPSSFRDSMSGIRAEDGSPDFTYYAFDYYGAGMCDLDYTNRLEHVVSLVQPFLDVVGDGYHAKIVVCPTSRVTSLEEIEAEEVGLLAAGWEGGILRRDDRPYKFNRATPLDGTLTKLKRFEDAEAIVVGYEAWEHNANEATSSPLGYTARSQHQENKVALERLGMLKVELLTDRSVKFGIGVMRGVTHGDRDYLWTIRESLIGRIAKFIHQGYGGGYDAPRTPVFIGWRDAIDL